MPVEGEENFLQHRLPAFNARGAPLPIRGEHPLNFLDSHIDENLVLKRVTALPSLVGDILDLADRRLSTFAASKELLEALFYLPPSAYREVPNISTAPEVAALRSDWIGFSCGQIAASILLYPDQPERGECPLTWTESTLDTFDNLSSDDFLCQTHLLTMARFRNRDPDPYSFSKENHDKLYDLGRYRSHWAVGLFFCPGAHQLLRDMDALISVGDADRFLWTINSIAEGVAPLATGPVPLDSPRPLFAVPPLAPVPQDRSLRRSRKRGFETPLADFYLPGAIRTANTISASWREEPRDFLQRAWVNAVRADSTFIILDCGNFLRIGVRHRASQTLLLSPMIDTRELIAENAGYGKLWVGLQLAIIDDVLQRFDRDRQQVHVPAVKRSLLDEDHPKGRKRPKGSVVKTDVPIVPRSQDMAPRQIEVLEKLFAKRSAVALYLRAGIYNSPSPSLLLKPGALRAERYATSDYILVTIKDRLGHGATGDVYRAILTGRPHPSLVLKLATNRERLCRLWHEHMIYSHLMESKVKGIPKVFGFYQDGRRNVGALLLSDAGRPLAKRSPDGKIPLTIAEKEQLTSILTGIHAAGVLHGDLRSWNFLVDAKGQISIIDFDRASRAGRPEEFVGEMMRLETFQRGENIDFERPIGRGGVASKMNALIMDTY